MKDHKCNLCDKIFSQNSHLDDHMQKFHYLQKNHTCDLCGKAFATPSKLKIHVDIVHDEVEDNKLLRNDKCDYCDKTFDHSKYLGKDNATNHKCVLCNKTFCHIEHFNCHYAEIHIGINKPENNLMQSPINEEHKNIKSKFCDKNDFSEKLMKQNADLDEGHKNIKSEFHDKMFYRPKEINGLIASKVQEE